MPINPRKNKIVLKRVEQENITESGIVISTHAKVEDNVGEVIAVHASVTDIHAGDKVVFDQYHFDKMTIKNEEFIIIDEQHVLAIIV